MGSLVLDKINYAEAKKLQIAQELGLTGNPTWNQIKTAIINTKNSYEQQIETLTNSYERQIETLTNTYEAADATHKLETSVDINIKWNNTPENIKLPSGGNLNKIFYFGDRTFCITDAYYELVNGNWLEKTWDTTHAPNITKGNKGIWLDGDGVLHYADISVYDPELDDWVEETGITGFSDIADTYAKYFWLDYDGKAHCDEHYNVNKHYVYDSSTKTWSTITWNITVNNMDSFIWTDGTTIYHSSGSSTYYLNDTNTSWVSKTWSIDSAVSNIVGNSIFYMPKYSVKSSNRETTPFYVDENRNFYKLDSTLGYWVNYKFDLSYTGAAKFWYCRIGTNNNTALVNFYTTLTNTTKSWQQIDNTWEALESSKNATLDYLMNN